MRRNLEAAAESFPQDVVELIGYLGEDDPEARVRAIPGVGTRVPVWILGSSLFGAQLAAWLGLPYSFASHFAPGDLEEALAVYRATFRPSGHLAAPCVMLAFNVFAAETDAEGRYLRTSMQQAFINLRTGRPGPLPRPVEDIAAVADPDGAGDGRPGARLLGGGVARDGAPRARRVRGAAPRRTS